MRAIGTDFVSLTLTLPRPDGELERVLLALTLQSKNIANTCLYLIRNVFAAYDYDKESGLNTLKTTLHTNQLDIIAHYNTHITLINGKREVKHPAAIEKALAKWKDAPELKLIPLLTPTMECLTATILDATVLDNAVRHWKSGKGVAVYKSLPGVMAQQVILSIKDDFSSFFKASQLFGDNPTDMTGRPQMPHYRAKHDRAVLEIPLAQVHQNLPTLKGKVVHADYLETLALSPEALGLFSGFNVEELIDKTCKKRGWTDAKPQHLRIVPLKRGVKMEVVVRVNAAYPENSFLDQLTRKHGKLLAEFKKPKQRDEWLANYLSALTADTLPGLCGIDLGMNNLAAVAYSTGHKAEIHTGGRFNTVVGGFNDRIDRFVSSNTPARAKELQAKKNALLKVDGKLPLDEHLELNSLLSKIYSHPIYLSLTLDKKNWISSFLHVLSHSLVMRCVAKKIGVIVLGKNIGWKQKSNLGKNNNRCFGQIAHATLINLIRYKAELHGIAVVTTEESYTSKTSFVNGDELEVYEAVKDTRNNETPRPVKTGIRSTSDRNWFVHKNRNDRWKLVHADVNGAFNIIRKVFKCFTYHAGLTLKFTLLRLSSQYGVSAIRCKI